MNNNNKQHQEQQFEKYQYLISRDQSCHVNEFKSKYFIQSKLEKSSNKRGLRRICTVNPG